MESQKDALRLQSQEAKKRRQEELQRQKQEEQLRKIQEREQKRQQAALIKEQVWVPIFRQFNVGCNVVRSVIGGGKKNIS